MKAEQIDLKYIYAGMAIAYIALGITMTISTNQPIPPGYDFVLFGGVFALFAYICKWVEDYEIV